MPYRENLLFVLESFKVRKCTLGWTYNLLIVNLKVYRSPVVTTKLWRTDGQRQIYTSPRLTLKEYLLLSARSQNEQQWIPWTPSAGLNS